MVRTKEQLEKMFAKSREEHSKKKVKSKIKNKAKPKKEEIDYLDGWKNDKDFLNEKFNFYSSKKRKRIIDKTIAEILYHVINGTEEELLDNYQKTMQKYSFGGLFNKPKSIEEVYKSEIYYIKKVYDGYLTNKYTNSIINKLKNKPS